MYKVLLASNSPRRRELLGSICPGFETVPPLEVDESYPETLPAAEVPVFLSQLKSKAYAEYITGETVLVTADTVVIVDGEILGKPHSHEDAVGMLKRLSGRTHEVVTGVTLATSGNSVSFAEKTLVHFDELSDEEIVHYVDTYRPYDKAGAYGIQEWIGFVGIKGIDGDYYNVMGLPLHALYRNLKGMF